MYDFFSCEIEIYDLNIDFNLLKSLFNLIHYISQINFGLYEFALDLKVCILQ